VTWTWHDWERDGKMDLETQAKGREMGMGEEGQEANEEIDRWRGMQSLLILSIISHLTSRIIVS
jgi:hypothetical protein